MPTSIQPTAVDSIDPVDAIEFDQFCGYLNDHLSDNGIDGGSYFQPLSRAESVLSADRAATFRSALDVPLFDPGWRRLWVARNLDGEMVGHVDLRAHPMKVASHRCVLGMGVDRRYRRIGLGRLLIAYAEEWAIASESLEWIDLDLISSNENAMRLYARSGFIRTGEIPDMFRIDGRSYLSISMTKNIARANGGD